MQVRFSFDQTFLFLNQHKRVTKNRKCTSSVYTRHCKCWQCHLQILIRTSFFRILRVAFFLSENFILLLEKEDSIDVKYSQPNDAKWNTQFFIDCSEEMNCIDRARVFCFLLDKSNCLSWEIDRKYAFLTQSLPVVQFVCVCVQEMWLKSSSRIHRDDFRKNKRVFFFRRNVEIGRNQTGCYW